MYNINFEKCEIYYLFLKNTIRMICKQLKKGY